MIKKRNLDNSLIQWIMTVTGLGPGIGEIHYLAPAVSATSQYRSTLNNMHVEDADLHTSLANSYAAVEGYRNDVILMLPGNSIETAGLAWEKHNTHLLGLGGPNTRGGDYGPFILTTDTAVVEVIDITARRCQFQNVAIGNFGNNLAAKAAVTVDGHGNYFKNVQFSGNLYAAQSQQQDCCSLRIDDDASMSLFEDCIIGTNVNATRNQASSGQLLFVGTTGPNGGKFKNCEFLSRAETLTVPMVRINATAAIDRMWLFDNCVFNNFWTNWADKCYSVFDFTPSVQTCSILLHNCASFGYDEWQTGNTPGGPVVITMPGADLDGGLSQTPTAELA